MNIYQGERPGVFSAYDVVSFTPGGRPAAVGLVARVGGGAPQEVVVADRQSELAALGPDGEGVWLQKMAAVLFAGGVTRIYVFPVSDGGGSALSAYKAGIRALEGIEELRAVLTDSLDASIRAALAESVGACSAARKERLGVAAVDSVSKAKT